MKTCTASLFYGSLFHGCPSAFWMHSSTRATMLKFSLNKSHLKVQASFSLSIIPPESQHSWKKSWIYPLQRRMMMCTCIPLTKASPSLAVLHRTFSHQCSFTSTPWGEDLYKATKKTNLFGSWHPKVGGNATWEFWKKLSRLARVSWFPQSLDEMRPWKVRVSSSITSHNGFTQREPHLTGLQYPVLCLNPHFSIQRTSEFQITHFILSISER